MSPQDLIVGIDLGTSTSAIACKRELDPTCAPSLVPLGDGAAIPTVVGLASDGTMLVGREAQRAAEPQALVGSFVHALGTEARFALGGRTRTPVELCARVLHALKAAAEAAYGSPCERAVVVVPAHFTDMQRRAMRQAAERAGLRAVRLLHAPTAAALAWAARAGWERRERVRLLCDIGGGHFGVSVVRTCGALVEVLATRGDAELGGEQIDALIAARIAHHLGVGPGSRDAAALSAHLRRAAEACKRALSTAARCPLPMSGLEELARRRGGAELALTRRQLDALLAGPLDHVLDAAAAVLDDAGVSAAELDDVVLAGGASQMPRVHEAVAALTGKAPQSAGAPAHQAALGAALCAAAMQDRTAPLTLVDLMPLSLGVSYFGDPLGAIASSNYTPIIARNTPLPCRRQASFATVFPGQSSIDLHLYQRGAAEPERAPAWLAADAASGNTPPRWSDECVAHVVADGLSPQAPPRSPVRFEFELDLDGLLAVRAVDGRDGRELSPRLVAPFEEPLPGPAHAAGADAENDADADEDEDRAAERAAVPMPPADTPAEHRDTWRQAHLLVERFTRIRGALGAERRELRARLDERVARLLGAVHRREFDRAAEQLTSLREELALASSDAE
ncbi:Hsp70 family protein [Haliangium ochraceum]|uniref:Heat shock protein 70 n=1 Tax=Haliangium ochraceum (strain DSM 14365 / JCM 11303 / SMP-2) TaxID=502025 RepID=D0LXA2_HALO1|nr:Hsp70 family protein [Haliangium ochraceum]ACY16144.1 Heat shock protein 70 [Haliangium ochraceum DSM 14365]